MQCSVFGTVLTTEDGCIIHALVAALQADTGDPVLGIVAIHALGFVMSPLRGLRGIVIYTHLCDPSLAFQFRLVLVANRKTRRTFYLGRYVRGTEGPGAWLFVEA